MRVIGLMSGTSADGVDAALVEWPPGDAARPFRLLAQREDPFPPELQQRIHALAAGRCAPGAALRELAALDVALGERFAEAAIAVAQAVHHIRPDTKIQPKYSTNTGVPGAVEGQP